MSSLDFSILNKGDIIFQEIYIETEDDGNSYYHNFGVLGLEPGARHNIHIYSPDELLFCSFYLYGISNESYIIENVAIEQGSIVYILPEHYIEFPETYTDLNDPDAVYGAKPYDRTRHFADLPELVNEDSFEPRGMVDVEIFNYTNSPVFRVYLEQDGIALEENYLTGGVMLPSESRTLSLPVQEGSTWKIKLAGPEDIVFTKDISSDMEADFLVFYDTDNLSLINNRTVFIQNDTELELTEVYLINQETSTREELLEGEVLRPLESRGV
ncbi:MAG: hypothetical protein PQJ58_03270, partial [Spirochaetales bacterium]|nr:hypothetical protein [Spirochaetales bacterium]